MVTDATDHRLDLITVSASGSLRDAMVAIGAAGTRLAVVVDVGDRFVGVVSDGDIRRALLGGSSMDDAVLPFVNRDALVVAPTASRDVVLDLMKARAVPNVPIVDEQGRFHGVHLFQEMLGRIDRPNLAMILAGGRGTRLLPLTETVPKPMVPVAGRPLLDRIVTHLVGFGLTRIVLSVGYLGDQIVEYFGDGHDHGCEISYLWEDPDTPLGSGGPLSLLRGSCGPITEPVLVMNGDLVTNFSVDHLLAHHAAAGSAITVAVREYTHQVPYGVVRVGTDGRVTHLEEKPVLASPISTGIYVISPEVLDRVPTGIHFPMTTLVEDCIRSGGVTAWSCDHDWEDIGQPLDLARARGEL